VLAVGWLILAVVAAILLTTWITFTLTRLDRLHARVDAAQAAMDAQLVRRAAALQHLAEAPDNGLPASLRGRCESVAQAALAVGAADATRADVENAVGRAVAEVASGRAAAGAGAGAEQLRPEAVAEMQEAAARVRIARRFYNDAVRDTRALRARRLPRLFRMAGRRAMPEFFDIDDTLPTGPVPTAPASVPSDKAPPDDRDEDQH
jgi:hypothetical protein